MTAAHPQPKLQIAKSPDYRETYANSVQIRVSVWDFFLNFGIAHQDTPDQVTVENNHGVYLSPQQAKALWNMLGQNLAQYEQAFGAITLEPHGPAIPMPNGPVH
jgi:flagellar protein FlaG